MRGAVGFREERSDREKGGGRERGEESGGRNRGGGGGRLEPISRSFLVRLRGASLSMFCFLVSLFVGL